MSWLQKFDVIQKSLWYNYGHYKSIIKVFIVHNYELFNDANLFLCKNKSFKKQVNGNFLWILMKVTILFNINMKEKLFYTNQTE